MKVSVYVCMYVCLAMQGEEIRPKWAIHTYIHGSMPFRKGTIFPCMFTFAHAGHGNRAPGDKFELQEAARGPPNIHTYIQTNKLTTRQFGFCTGFYTTSKLEFHVCLPMPAEEIDTYISKFVNLGISISTARATFFDENVQKMTKT